MTFLIIFFQVANQFQPNAPDTIINHDTIIIRNENTIIADINNFISHCINIGNAVTLVTLTVPSLLDSLFNSIQFQIKGIVIFNSTQQHFLSGSQIHLVWASLAFVSQEQVVLQSLQSQTFWLFAQRGTQQGDWKSNQGSQFCPSVPV